MYSTQLLTVDVMLLLKDRYTAADVRRNAAVHCKYDAAADVKYAAAGVRCDTAAAVGWQAPEVGGGHQHFPELGVQGELAHDLTHLCR